jgi:hypothetical protein
MKKLIYLTLCMVLGFCLVTPVYASILDTGMKWVDDHVGKVGTFYDFLDGEFKEIAGATIVNDLGIKRLDLDLFTDLDEGVILGLDYTIKEDDGIEPFIGVGIGVNRFESFEDRNEFGEFMAGITAGAKF